MEQLGDSIIGMASPAHEGKKSTSREPTLGGSFSTEVTARPHESTIR